MKREYFLRVMWRLFLSWSAQVMYLSKNTTSAYTCVQHIHGGLQKQMKTQTTTATWPKCKEHPSPSYVQMNSDSWSSWVSNWTIRTWPPTTPPLNQYLIMGHNIIWMMRCCIWVVHETLSEELSKETRRRGWGRGGVGFVSDTERRGVWGHTGKKGSWQTFTEPDQNQYNILETEDHGVLLESLTQRGDSSC